MTRRTVATCRLPRAAAPASLERRSLLRRERSPQPAATGKVPVAVAALLFVISCAANVSRDDWRRMSPDEKTLYVKSLIGGEVARERKGGEARKRTPAPHEIIEAIDAAYANGDTRSAEEIFNTLAVRQDSPQQPRPASHADG